jgi:polyhydroxyalkanoate synthase
MFNFINNQYQQYLDDYFSYLETKKPESSYKRIADEIKDCSDLIQIFQYKCKTNTEEGLLRHSFLVIPSLFNSPDILFFNEDKSLISTLLRFGDVYLVDWQESTIQRTLDQYVLELSKVIDNLAIKTSTFEVIGHCLGGNIAIGLKSLQQSKISAITLLTTPWDYSHFNHAAALHRILKIDSMIENLDIIPKTYIQIMFFLLFPDQFCQKIIKYSDLKSLNYKETYMKVENWLQSGVDIPKSIYLELIDDLASKNIMYNNNWSIEGKKVILDDIDCPVCIISAKEDRIVPINSTLPLHNIIKNSRLIIVEGGHISYLLNYDKKFHEDFSYWINTLNNNYLER